MGTLWEGVILISLQNVPFFQLIVPADGTADLSQKFYSTNFFLSSFQCFVVVIDMAQLLSHPSL